MKLLSSIEQALQALKDGRFVVVVDNENRENEGDLILSAAHASPEALAFMIRHTSGIICVPMKKERLDALQLPLMVRYNTEVHRTAFTVSVDYAIGTTTGVSAQDRSLTIRALANEYSKAEDFRKPGHLFPLIYTEGGVLERPGHTEAAIDLCTLAGLAPVGVLAELTNDDGTMQRLPDLIQFAKKYNFPLISIDDLIAYRKKREVQVTCVSKAALPTPYGLFTICVYRSSLNDLEHIALVCGEVAEQEQVLVRIHSECFTGDVLGSLRCDCGTQLHQALEMISLEGKGVLVYLKGHEGRGAGLEHKVHAYHLQDQGRDTVEADLELGSTPDSREYGIGAQILKDLGVSSFRLITNNPSKCAGLQEYGLQIVERVAVQPFTNLSNRSYLITKKNKLGHLIEI